MSGLSVFHCAATNKPKPLLSSSNRLPGARQPMGAPAGKLFVGGLSPVTNEDTLFAYFSNFGTVTQSEVRPHA